MIEMSSAIKTVLRPGRQSAVDPVEGSRWFFTRLVLAFKVYRERRALLGMSDAALKDIGLSRADAFREGARSLWDLPGNR
jgi:uncharacterized protein YjiS (DUF1127 family)